MNDKVEKPITMIRQEFIDKLIYEINNCSLPLFVIEPILKDVYMEVKHTLQMQCEAEKSQYEQKLDELSSKKDDAQT